MPDSFYKLLITVFFVVQACCCFGQSSEDIYITDSLTADMPGIESFTSMSKLDPDKAALYSAVFPGMGQIYNQQYWKLPIIYGGFIMIGHYINQNNNFYNEFRNAWTIANENGDQLPTDHPLNGFTKDALQRNAERFRRDRDLLIIVGVAAYILNIVDAHVAAHLAEFDINEDLSIAPRYQDQSMYTQRNIGLSLVINLNK